MSTVKLSFLAAAGLIAASMLAPGTAAHAQERREVPETAVFGPSDPGTIEAVDALLDAYRTAWASEDAAAFGALHTEDTEWINAYARMFRGRDALVGFLRDRLFPAFDPDVSAGEAANMRRISTRLIGADAAVVHLYTDGRRGPASDGSDEARRTHFHLVLARTPDGWRVAHTAIMDARN